MTEIMDVAKKMLISILKEKYDHTVEKTRQFYKDSNGATRDEI